MEGQRSRLPVFVAIHKKGIAQQKAEQEDKEKIEEENRNFWIKKGMVDHQHDLSDEDTDRGNSDDSDSDYGGGKKNHTNRKYKIKTRKNKSKNKKSKNRWSLKYKKSINCKRPRGFSQRQYCNYGRKKSYRK
jgi:hypothetical protein